MGLTRLQGPVFIPPNSSYCALFIAEFTVVFVSTVVFMLSLHVCIHICIQAHSVSTLQLNPMLTSSTTDLLHIEFPICIYSHWTHLQDTRECFHKLGSVLLEESRFGGKLTKLGYLGGSLQWVHSNFSKFLQFCNGWNSKLGKIQCKMREPVANPEY